MDSLSQKHRNTHKKHLFMCNINYFMFVLSFKHQNWRPSWIWPLKKLAHTFAMGTLSNFSKKPFKMMNQEKKILMVSTVTEVPDLTHL